MLPRRSTASQGETSCLALTAYSWWRFHKQSNGFMQSVNTFSQICNQDILLCEHAFKPVYLRFCPDIPASTARTPTVAPARKTLLTHARPLLRNPHRGQ